MEFLDINTIGLFAFSISLAKIWSGFTVLLGLGLVIFFHELGHFAVAKWCDVHVERFSIGIGPIIWSRQKGETEYALSALPFGGYVKMLGQDDMDSSQMTSDEIAESPRSYTSKKVWQRMAIISAGVIMNVITGFLFFAIAYRSGVTETVPMVGNVAVGSPAWHAGLEQGDTFLEIGGQPISCWRDMTHAVALSSGSIDVEISRIDGSTFETTLTPEIAGIARMIGVSSSNRTTLTTSPIEGSSIAIPGLPAADASEEFKWGDRVVSVNGENVEYLFDIEQISARQADNDLVFEIDRPQPSEDGTISDDSPVSRVSITVPSRRIRTPGFMMAVGPVSAVRKGSIADEAGLKEGDQITLVDELVVSKDIDPLQLPDYLSDKAGEEVNLTIKRQTSDDGRTEETITLIPADIPASTRAINRPTSAMGLPSIGAGIHIQPRIASISEEAEQTYKGKLQANQKVTRIDFILNTSGTEKSDGLGKEEIVTIDIAAIESEQDLPGKPNWAYVHTYMQMAPNRDVKVYIEDGGDGENKFSLKLTDIAPVDDWFLATRGISGWRQLTKVRKVDSLAEAAGVGLKMTKDNGATIYMTLVSLFRGNLSVKALSGPLGIIQAGTHEAGDGMTRLLNFLGFLSINLAVLNFLPIPVLDGGHMVFLIWEAVARKKPSPRVINLAHGVGLVFLLSLFVFVLSMDFLRLAR